MSIFWTEINNFHTVKKTLDKYPELLQGQSRVTYKAKVKLHGTCAGVMVDSSGNVKALSRTAIITPQSDNCGFARWVHDNYEKFSSLKDFVQNDESIIVYGEWCGKGIQKGVALNQIDRKIFAVFAARFITQNVEGDYEYDFVHEPLALVHIVPSIDDCHVISWYAEGAAKTIDWSASNDDLVLVTEHINEDVDIVERCDPWVLSTFNVTGIGEGLVYYPIGSTERTISYKTFSDLCFKAKGQKHQVLAKTKSAQVEPTIAAGLQEFVELVVTPARLEQGVRSVSGGEFVFNVKDTGNFIKWINADLVKETALELEASGLEAKQAYRACCEHARCWFTTMARNS